jgi:hypothetical protein
MNLVYGVQQVMHRIRVKLYRNYFPKGGPYIARTDSEATLNIDQVGAARRDRGGLTMDFEDFIDGVKQFFEEMIYQLCDGFAVNTGYFTIYPNLGGTFKSVHETPDPKTHPLTFRFHACKPLRDIASGIHIVVEGLAENSTSRIIGIAPQTGHQFNKVEVRTQFAGSGNVFLKTMRIITGDFTLEEA